MNLRNLLRALPRAIVLLAAVLLAGRGGWYLLWLLLALALAWDIFRVFRPAPAIRAPAKYREPGEHRVVLQVTGPKAIHVIRALRLTRGLGLVEAKNLVEAAPVVVAEGLSERSAELVVDRLRAAGARALAAPIGEM